MLDRSQMTYEDLVTHFKHLHSVFCKYADNPRPWTFACETMWSDWERTGPEFTEENLILVIKWLQAEKKAGNIKSLKWFRFENLIGVPDEFANHLGPALAAKGKAREREIKAKREYVDPGKVEVQRATGHDDKRMEPKIFDSASFLAKWRKENPL